ncbi:unnamed protein product [Owenia fusiformis]|uniref:Uncharacterized protein n=1 Tax=Owenia fusiformis TaxID=6347 RepID=A0A8S4NQ51_OWEFU|nr:unnamed protein product [Owenia fusiformis]
MSSKEKSLLVKTLEFVHGVTTEASNTEMIMSLGLGKYLQDLYDNLEHNDKGEIWRKDFESLCEVLDIELNKHDVDIFKNLPDFLSFNQFFEKLSHHFTIRGNNTGYIPKVSKYKYIHLDLNLKEMKKSLSARILSKSTSKDKLKQNQMIAHMERVIDQQNDELECLRQTVEELRRGLQAADVRSLFYQVELHKLEQQQLLNGKDVTNLVKNCDINIMPSVDIPEIIITPPDDNMGADTYISMGTNVTQDTNTTVEINMTTDTNGIPYTNMGVDNNMKGDTNMDANTIPNILPENSINHKITTPNQSTKANLQEANDITTILEQNVDTATCHDQSTETNPTNDTRLQRAEKHVAELEEVNGQLQEEVNDSHTKLEQARDMVTQCMMLIQGVDINKNMKNMKSDNMVKVSGMDKL